jgi:selenide,water dikinase
VPQNKLLSYLSKLPKPVGIETPDVSTIKVPPYTLVSTLDFFYPLVESPYMFGRIAFCNTVSDLYAMGITDIKEVLMILGVSTDMSELEKDVATTMMIQGFTDAAQQAKTQVGGGQTVYNQWPMMGGCAIAVVKDDEFVMPNNAEPGDAMILTKPLGARFAINAMQWLKTSKEKRDKILEEATESELV